ncbi:glyoxylase-like metal-dependent hydrolase (beta-lactamase superfamily II) [Arthrobacter sp. CAN_A212]|uniref:MBL fold metallo-hydrolase n=1 Tax=unclassified Arthrobacter TaxID=235627 RepID=UPI0018C8DD09|nr:MBL fold metallo-hydrolase [Arthrobacter sp. CAN_C5]MBP2214946.1 glyoxylase-like metal-dependent hydrolase (beta-lactamase superfamily II) [Arthrobacter sp. CAN_C5]
MPNPTPSGLVSSSPQTRYRLAPNPGPMSLEGTNSYLIAATAVDHPAERPVVVVDPGPLDDDHLAGLAGTGRVELVLITHRHHDHTASSERFHQLTGAPVRALDPVHCHGGPPLADGEEILAAGVRLRVIATPGHTSDSVCFFLPDDGDAGSVLTGDTILGRGTTIIDYPDGRLGPYLASLERLAGLGPAAVLPGHGPMLPDLAVISRAYVLHRRERLDQIRAALTAVGADASVEQVTDLVYADVDSSVRRAAEASVAAQLDYLQTTG